MRHILTFLSFLLILSTAHAQAPQGIPYQAAARNSSGAVIASTSVSVRFTIRDSVTTGAIKYRETHSTTTDANGMFSLTVGQGTPVSGTFASINWGTNAKFLQVELDPAGGSSYTDMGTQQMMSVPYALNASVLKLTVSAMGDTLYSGGGNYVIIPGISAANCTVSAGTITGTVTVCAGSSTTLSNATNGGTWSSSTTGVATVGSTGIVSGVSSGIATISYTITESCGSATTTIIVTVNPLPLAGTITGTATVCTGSTSTLSNATTGGEWSSSATGVATVGITGVVTGVAAGTATISYIFTNTCGSAVATRVVTINALPNAGTITGTATVCVGSTIALSNAITGGTWSSSATGVATVGGTGVVTGISVGTATISYSVTTSCGSALTTRVVTVNPLTSPGTITGSSTVIAGSTITLSNAATGGTWSSSNTSIVIIGSTGVVTGIATGTATISYTVTSACGSAVATKIVTVNAALAIGASYGGGKIAYILQPGDPGYVAGENHGIVAASSDQISILWGCYGTGTFATSTALGTGSANTALLSAPCAGAARYSSELVLAGYSDWYLPSRDELQIMYINRGSIGGFTTGFYWSSSDHSAFNAYGIYFHSGYPDIQPKSYQYLIRVVRSF